MYGIPKLKSILYTDDMNYYSLSYFGRLVVKASYFHKI